MRTVCNRHLFQCQCLLVGMKPLSERDENIDNINGDSCVACGKVGMKPLSERDENRQFLLNRLAGT